MQKCLLIVLGAGFLASCQKKDDKPANSWTWFGTSTPAVYNYVLINATQVVTDGDSDENHVGISAAFIDSSNHQVGAVSVLRVNNQEIRAGSDYFYNYSYAGADPDNEPAFGSDVKVNIRGDAEDDTVSSQVYLPKRLRATTAGFPSVIHKSDGYALEWLPDLENTWGNVVIQVIYFADLSVRNDASLPKAIPTVSITVADNGSYTLSKDDLSNFPPNSVVGVTIARGTQNHALLPLSRKRIFYFTSTALSTPPIRVVP